MKTNKDIIEAFLSFERKDMKVGHIRIIDDCLYSYYTCIAEIKDSIILINCTKYSKTTSNHISLLRRNIPKWLTCIYLDDVPLETRHLSSLNIITIINP